MDVRLTPEQRQLRNAAAKLADDLGPGSVQDLSDESRIARLEKAVDATAWRSLRSDGASGVEVAIVAEEFGRGLVDVPFVGPVLTDELQRAGAIVSATDIEQHLATADLTRAMAAVPEAQAIEKLAGKDRDRFQALAVTSTTADILGTARGAHALAVDYAKVREQYGKPIGSYQAVAHMLAEGLALIEGSISVLRHAAWAVDELEPAEAIRAANIAKVYCVRAARTVCETAIQVHGGIGNTWECLAHVYLRRALTSAELFPVSLKEIDFGLS